MLLFRLKILAPLVDKFVVVESNHTFSGKPKPYYSDELDERFDEFKGKLIIHKHHANLDGLDLSKKPQFFDQSHDCWAIEKQQRNAIGEALSHYPEDAIVLMGDVDEIPDREAVRTCLDMNYGKFFPICLLMCSFYHNLKFLRHAVQRGELVDMQQSGQTIVTNVKTLVETGAENMRRNRTNIHHRMQHGGYHLSYFGDVKTKLDTFSHQELNNDLVSNDEHIAECIETGKDLFYQDVPVVKVTKAFFPPEFVDNVLESWW